MKITIRTAREVDAEAITELLNPIIETGLYSVIIHPVSVDEQIAWIRSVSDRGVFHVAEGDEDGTILGFQSLEPQSAFDNAQNHVGEIATFVSLNAHRQGIGRRLCEATFRAAQERGFRKIMATIRADNPQAISFYHSQGFEVIGTARRHAYVRGEYVDEILTEKHFA